LTALPPVVILVAKAFQRPDIPRARQEAKTLLEAGYRVYVLAWDRSAEFPVLENVDGAKVRSLSLVNLPRFSRLRLALGGIIFQTQLIFETVKLISQLKQRPIVHAHDVNTLLVGCFLRMIRLCSALVYDCREFTYGLYYEWFNPSVASVVGSMEKRCLRYADAVITVCEPIATYLHRYNSNTEIVYNCPRVEDIPRLSKKEARIQLGLPPSAFIVSHVGTIRYGCKFDLLLAVASLARNYDFQCLIVGDGPLASEVGRVAREAKNARAIVVQRVPRKLALSYVLASDLTWAVYDPIASPNSAVSLPWKLFESLACGVPVIVEQGTLRAKLVRELGCGIVLENDDPEYVSQVILSLANNPDRSRKMCAEAKSACTALKFDWETMSEKLIRIYRRLPLPERQIA